MSYVKNAHVSVNVISIMHEFSVEVEFRRELQSETDLTAKRIQHVKSRAERSPEANCVLPGRELPLQMQKRSNRRLP